MDIETMEEVPTQDTEQPEPDMSLFLQQNVAELIGEVELKKIAAEVMDAFETDVRSCSSYHDEIAELLELTKQPSGCKTYPFHGASNMRYPLLVQSAMKFAAFAMPAFINNGRVVDFTVEGIDPQGMKKQAATRMSQYMNYRILKTMTDWQMEFDRMLNILPITGTCIRKVSYCPELRRPKVSTLDINNFTVDGGATNLFNARRMSDKVYIAPHNLKTNIRSGLFLDQDYHTDEMSLDQTMQNTFDDGKRVLKPDNCYTFVEMHIRLDLDDDGYSEPYSVFLHKDSGKIARIQRQYLPEDVQYNEDGEVIYVKQFQSFIPYSFFLDIEGGFFGRGLGHYQAGTQEAIGTSLNMFIDAVHLSNTSAGFISEEIRIMGGTMRFQPGEYKRVKASLDALQRGIIPLPRPEPTMAAQTLIEFLVGVGEKISSLNMLKLDELPANTPATTTMAIVDMGLQEFSSIFKRVYTSLQEEINVISRYCSLYDDLGEYGQITGQPVFHEDFAAMGVSITPSADLTAISSTQRMAKANYLATFKDDPLFNVMKIRQDLLEAVQIYNPEQYLQSPQPQQPDPMMLAQLELVKAQTELAGAQSRSLGVDGQIKGAKLDSDLANKESDTKVKEATIIEKMASATQKIADAESKEAGTQIGEYVAVAQSLLGGSKLDHDREKSYRDYDFKERESMKYGSI